MSTTIACPPIPNEFDRGYRLGSEAFREDYQGTCISEEDIRAFLAECFQPVSTHEQGMYAVLDLPVPTHEYAMGFALGWLSSLYTHDPSKRKYSPAFLVPELVPANHCCTSRRVGGDGFPLDR